MGCHVRQQALRHSTLFLGMWGLLNAFQMLTKARILPAMVETRSLGEVVVEMALVNAV